MTPPTAPAVEANAEWIDRCRSRFLQLDPMLPPAELAPIVTDMSQRASWRSMAPEIAADRVFVPHPQRGQRAVNPA